jgi:uncharacterized protein YggE
MRSQRQVAVVGVPPRTLGGRARAAFVCAALVLLGVPLARAADNDTNGSSNAANANSTITVTGSGDAKARPTIVEMTAVVSGEAELAADAVVKYKDSRRRAVKALEDLKIPSLAIESKGFTLNQGIDSNQQQMMMMRGQMPTTSKQRVQVTEPLRLVIKGVDKMKDEDLMGVVLKVIDAGRDAGLTVGPGAPNYYQMQMMMQRGDNSGAGMASFKIAEPAALREQAYAKAIENARAKAQSLAQLAGVKLGRVTSVQEGGTPPQAGVVYYAGMPQVQEGELSSQVAGDITMNVRLTVQFAIQ